MVPKLPGSQSESVGPQVLPTLIVKATDNEMIRVRYQRIGHQKRFQVMLQRLRFEFPLARCTYYDSQPWWLIAASQRDQLSEFCKRNGLQLVEEE
jgi:hypothetical protein